MLVGAAVGEMQTGGGGRRRRRRLLPDTQRSTRAAAAHYSFYPQMSQFVSEFCVGPNLAPPPAVNSTPPQTFCRRCVAPSHHRAQPLLNPPKPQPVVPCSAAAAVGGGSNAAARCKPPACCACSALACATRVPHAASLPMRLPLSLAPRHLYCLCTAALRNSPAQRCATPPLSNPFSFSYFMQPAKARCSCVHNRPQLPCYSCCCAHH